MENRIKVVLADANENFRTMLQQTIENTGEFDVVGSAGDGAEAWKMIERERPQLVITDVILPELDGFALLDRMAKLPARPKTILRRESYPNPYEALKALTRTNKAITHEDIRNMIKELGKESTVILSSHILPEVSAVCDRVLILNKGKIVAEDTPDRLKGALADNERLTLSILGDKSKIEQDNGIEE